MDLDLNEALEELIEEIEEKLVEAIVEIVESGLSDLAEENKNLTKDDIGDWGTERCRD